MNQKKNKKNKKKMKKVLNEFLITNALQHLLL